VRHGVLEKLELPEKTRVLEKESWLFVMVITFFTLSSKFIFNKTVTIYALIRTPSVTLL
jgi:hypothetical protein